jgi:tRNA(His) 5'-end guanylyltransferase
MIDQLGDRIKTAYEDRTRFSLPRRAYTIIRIDGKAFHTYTRKLQRPFDDTLIDDIDTTAAYLCKNIMGAQFAFTQSDEISILLTDFNDITTQAWFDNNLQKMCSVSASMATKAFNEARFNRLITGSKEETINIKDFLKMAEFDSRVFQIPQRAEVENYFIWRQQDTTRNSISSVAQSMFSSKELHGKTTNKQQDMIFQKSGINWNDYESKYKRGRIITKHVYEKSPGVVRSEWKRMDEIPIFTQDRSFLIGLIPVNN